MKYLLNVIRRAGFPGPNVPVCRAIVISKEKAVNRFIELLFGGMGYLGVAVAAGTLGDFFVAIVEVYMGTDRTTKHLLFGRDVFFRLPLILVVDPGYKYPEEEKEDVEKKTADILTGIIVLASLCPVVRSCRRL